MTTSFSNAIVERIKETNLTNVHIPLQSILALLLASLAILSLCYCCYRPLGFIVSTTLSIISILGALSSFYTITTKWVSVEQLSEVAHIAQDSWQNVDKHMR